MYTVKIKMITNKGRVEINETLVRTMNRAMQYVKGNLGINSVIESYSGCELNVCLSNIETTNIDIVIDKFFTDFDGATRALATQVTKGVKNRFYAPRQFSDVRIYQNGELVSETKGISLES